MPVLPAGDDRLGQPADDRFGLMAVLFRCTVTVPPAVELCGGGMDAPGRGGDLELFREHERGKHVALRALPFLGLNGGAGPQVASEGPEMRIVRRQGCLENAVRFGVRLLALTGCEPDAAQPEPCAH